MRIQSIDPEFGLILNAGHGGIDPQTKKYTTAPSKQFRHEDGCYHREGYFYEGVWNRKLSDLIYEKMTARGVRCFRVYHEFHDYKLSTMVEMVEDIYRRYPKVIGLSNHANSSPFHNAMGWEVFSSRGQTRSDWMAHHLGKMVKILLPELKYRGVKEKDFMILKRTPCPFILVEWGFFDHFIDAQFLMDETNQERIADLVVDWLFAYIKHYRLATFYPFKD